MMKPIKILVPADDLDSVTRNMLARIDALPQFSVTVAGEGEGDRGGVEAPAIRSKMDRHAIMGFRAVMKRIRPDLTFSPSTSGLATMLMASIGLGIKNIGYRGTQAKVRRSDPTNFLALLNPRVKHVVCETDDIECYLGGIIGKSKVSTATKPFELDWVKDAVAYPLAVENAPADAFKLITIGMFKGRPHKGLRPLIEAMSMLEDLNVTLTVIGSADDVDMAVAPKSVRFLGPRKDAVRFIPTHDLYVLSSTRDASPRVVREAQACGVPCLVSEIPGAKDLIAPGDTGEYIKAGDAGDIAAHIRALYHDRATLRRYASMTRDYIGRNYRENDYIAYFANLFEKIAKGK